MTRRLLLPLFLLLFVAIAGAAIAGAAVAADAPPTEAPAPQPAEEAVDREQPAAQSETLPTVLPELRIDHITGISPDCWDAWQICMMSCPIRGSVCHDNCVAEYLACI